MTTGVVLMTYGAPSGDGDVASYLARVRGRAPAPELVAEMRRRYQLIGGSPLIEITRAQAEALAAVLGTGFTVRAGMRFSEPSIEGEVRALVAEGATRVVGVPMSPQWSDRLMAPYEHAVAESSSVPCTVKFSRMRPGSSPSASRCSFEANSTCRFVAGRAWAQPSSPCSTIDLRAASMIC